MLQSAFPFSSEQVSRIVRGIRVMSAASDGGSIPRRSSDSVRSYVSSLEVLWRERVVGEVPRRSRVDEAPSNLSTDRADQSRVDVRQAYGFLASEIGEPTP